MLRLSIILIILFSLKSFSQTITTSSIYDSISVMETHCNIRQTTHIFSNGVEISSYATRWSIEPGGDLSKFDARVKAVCQAGWTPDVKTKYKKQVDENNKRWAK